MSESAKYLVLLVVSWTSLFIKGFNYMLLDRWSVLASCLIFLVSGLMAYKTQRGVLLVLRLWSVGLIMWAVIRLLLCLMILFFQKIPELHANQQFGFSSLPATIIVLIIGVFLYRNAKSFIKAKATSWRLAIDEQD